MSYVTTPQKQASKYLIKRMNEVYLILYKEEIAMGTSVRVSLLKQVHELILQKITKTKFSIWILHNISSFFQYNKYLYNMYQDY